MRRNSCYQNQVPDYLLVVATANTSTNPHAVMIKLVNAIVADVAMRGPKGSENEARLAELQTTHLGHIHLLDGLEKDAIILVRFAVLLRQFCALDAPYSSGNDTWVCHGGAKKVKVSSQLESK